MSKIVTVVKEKQIRYRVDTEPGKALSDEEVIAIIQARMDAGSPLGVLDEKEKTVKFQVEEA